MTIHLDTNFLIAAIRGGTEEEARVITWQRERRQLQLSAVVWSEYLCGPVSTREADMAAELLGEPIAFGAIDATLAARLFNVTGRRRTSLADCMIAATALRSGAALATNNVADFRPFEPHGLLIAPP